MAGCRECGGRGWVRTARPAPGRPMQADACEPCARQAEQEWKMRCWAGEMSFATKSQTEIKGLYA